MGRGRGIEAVLRAGVTGGFCTCRGSGRIGRSLGNLARTGEDDVGANVEGGGIYVHPHHLSDIGSRRLVLLLEQDVVRVVVIPTDDWKWWSKVISVSVWSFLTPSSMMGRERTGVGG
jgi:hypothetical protein